MSFRQPGVALLMIAWSLSLGCQQTSMTAASSGTEFYDGSGAEFAEAWAPGSGSSVSSLGGVHRASPPFNTERYDAIEEEGFLSPIDNPLSTFSIDVDTASYSNVRRFIHDGQLPPSGAVRIEELINYFRFDYPDPTGESPISITTEWTESPWKPGHQLVLVGLKGRSIPEISHPPRNLVFLVDVSGSMQDVDKLPLVRRALSELVQRLNAGDHVGIVVYAGESGVLLEPTEGTDRARILASIADLEAGGSTNGAGGIRAAYELAHRNFRKDAINRVILVSDGDFNVGTTSESELVDLIESERETGVFLTVLGVGKGNLNDSTMEKLADHGNGSYHYLDSLAEARRVLVAEGGSTLLTIAKDVKIQVEFNPAKVSGYRLIGYENRRLADRDFNDDTKDAGEIGAGHSMTALYEIVPAGVDVDTGSIDPLRYQNVGSGDAPAMHEDELLAVKLRWKEPDGEASRLTSHVVTGEPVPLDLSSTNLKFASAVAMFGLLLRDSEYAGDGNWETAQALARASLGEDTDGFRAEFIRLIAMARDLQLVED